MAEQIPYGVTVSIINRLASLAFREFGRINGVMDELEKLKNTVESIQAVLLDAEERQDQDRAVKIWISRLKQVVHDADNLLDDFRIQDLLREVNGHNSEVSNFFSSSKQVVFRHKMARKVEKIRQQFNDVAQDMSKLKLNQRMVICKENENAWRETSSFVLQSEIIGREESKKEIIDLLKQTHTNQNVSLIAIVGIGGLGKTALAQLVYNDAEVQDLFEKKMWVCISEDFEVKTVVKKMLKSLNVGAVDELELEQLQKKLQEELNGKRYMLVLDDVWNESQLEWDAVRTYLMCGGQGSKIIVTTRNKSVAETMGINIPYVLEGLTEEKSWDLLKNLAFGEDARRMSPSLESIGKRIAEKCRGVPLAIRTMGGFLRSKHEESEWLSILHDDFWGQCKERKSIMPILKLSYQNLPLELRQCFVYCSLYPKDRVIQRGELVQLWMAQGYLECSIETQSMEDVGNQYVKILLMRSFFQDASMSEYNDITSFKMHDLMHDLATSIAGNDCYLDSEGKGIVGKPMHVSFVSNTICSLDSLDASKLRTLLWSKNQFGFMTKPSVITKLKFLRALNLSYSSITNLPESIDKFNHLRYLNLSCCHELISLPKSLGNLVSLQTLKLKRCLNLVFCVEVITKLISLRHLDIESCKAFEEMMPAGLGKLTSLQYLSDFVVGEDDKRKSSKLNELKQLDNIRDHLRIRNLGLVKDVASESHEANMKAKKYIQCLELQWGESFENKNSDNLQLLDNLCPHHGLRKLIVVSYPGERFSGWLPSLTNIVHIRFFGFSNCKHLPPLERLPCLKTLWISEMEELKNMYYEEISPVFFPSLETLSLKHCWNLNGWQRLLADVNNANDIDNHLSLPPFPRLFSLEIMECPNLTCMPPYPHLVQMLDLRYCSVKPMIGTCLVQLQPSSSYPLSALKHLEIGEIDMEAMPEDWMRNLTSLQRLSVCRLPSIELVLRHMQQLPVELEELEIIDINDDKLDLWKDEEDVSTQCQAPHPHALPSLHKISIHFCDNLKALPERIRDLQSLRHITVSRCPKLESLPEAMRCLTNLQTLRISGCPLLRDRCQNESGADWPKIAHIPNITVL